ncbi:cytochrome P450 [Amycolatopsis sp.]|uniref:cytochrome P450 n=1 Tax=Amycolatopsis sp. TaxID=37632 RepID=UPI002CC61D6D|nr:cytochrome P450 [Amycolatopsis sp.]HVV08144.1 cytochrome P450 [Amycolatopsis sp.]
MMRAPLTDPEFYAGDPHPVYAWLRAEEPVHWSEQGQFWALSKYEDVRAAGRDPELFSSARGTLLTDGRARDAGGPHPPGARHLMRSDPPMHTDLRRIVARSFTPRAVTALEDRARIIARDLVAEIEPESEVDVVAALSAPLTTFVIAELMGVPRDRWAEFWTWTDSAILQVDAGRDDPAHAANVTALREYFAELCERRRREPGDDVITDLVAGGLNELDLLTYCKFLLVAGTETTRNLISGGVELLAADPGQRRLLAADSGLLPDAVEEMLRFVSPVVAFCRTATRDTEIRGTRIAAGDYVALLYASANRDEEVWREPGRFDVTRRSPRPHVAFGFGPHVCLGATLARMEARVAFEELLKAYPDFALAGPARRGPSTLVSMISALPVVFG